LAQATHKNPDARPFSVHVARGVREAAALLFGAVALFLVIALLSYDPADPGWSHTGTGLRAANLGGRAGAWFADVFLYLFGYLAILAPVIVGYSGWLVFNGRKNDDGIDLRILGLRWAGFLITLAAGCGLATLHFASAGLPLNAGGILGDVIGELMVDAFSMTGTTLILLALFLAGFTLFSGLSWFSLMDGIGRLVLGSLKAAREAWEARRERKAGAIARQEREAVVKQEKEKTSKRSKPRIEPVVNKIEVSERVERERQIPLFEPAVSGLLPPLALLDPPREEQGGYSEAALEAMSRQVELKLKDFGIEVEVVAVHPGPVITRFELQPAAGVKVSRISALAKDLARALSVVSVRIVEVIPGKSTVGLEIPNEHRELVALSEILQSKVFEGAHSPLTIALGKDIGGQAMVADLARMPHLLVAGTTGSGKSVAINAMLLSLLYKSGADETRLILIDPKMLELSVYEGIPHLLTPVVTDMKDAANALRWCVAEMERRYKLMSRLGVRNIGGYNRKVAEAGERGETIPDPLYDPSKSLDPTAPPPPLQALPFIVVVVDEFADMMMVVGKKVEELIARLAQKARAAGIHLVLATQRPSVDVITGLIKANIPSRIAFQVSSRVDSRTILDQMGADQLLGHGDMLYLPPGTAHPIRVHGAYVADHEVHKVVEYLKSSGEPNYLEEIVQQPEGNGDYVPGLEPVDSGAESDPLYDEAVAIVLETRKASISYVQRRLKIGYNRAARMIEDMEAAGVVSALQSNGNREVLAPAPPRD
jgi:S-DNA-T family DNA segregation ATPase FtsK/SpoIIIE